MLEGTPLLAGEASGPVLTLDEPISFWGGLDPETGRIIDRRHPQCGASVTGVILLMPHGRGSSSSSSVLAEAIRLGTAPAAIVLAEPDEIVVLGALVAEELYGRTCPVVVLDPDRFASASRATKADVTVAGAVGVASRPAPSECADPSPQPEA